MASLSQSVASLSGRKLLNNNATADRLDISQRTLPVWRVQGRGPRHIKVGRLVRYDEAEVNAWLEANTHTSTSQNAR